MAKAVPPGSLLRVAWIASLGGAVSLRAWNALAGPMLHGYDGWSHVAYVLFLDLYGAIPWADQGWAFGQFVQARELSIGGQDVHGPLCALLGEAAFQQAVSQLRVRQIPPATEHPRQHGWVQRRAPQKRQVLLRGRGEQGQAEV